MTNNKIKFTIAAFALLACLSGTTAYAQDDDEPRKDPATLAATEAERLANQYGLDDAQLFHLDSVMCHDYVAMCTELEKLSKAKVENIDLYYSVQDKWYEQIDASMKKIMTPEQWEKYLKQGGKKRANDRAKRREKMEKATNSEKLNKKK